MVEEFGTDRAQEKILKDTNAIGLPRSPDRETIERNLIEFYELYHFDNVLNHQR